MVASAPKLSAYTRSKEASQHVGFVGQALVVAAMDVVPLLLTL
jgi:hypothetical protein